MSGTTETVRQISWRAARVERQEERRECRETGGDTRVSRDRRRDERQEERERESVMRRGESEFEAGGEARDRERT